MRNATFVFAVLTGYSAMSFAVLKIFWRHFGVHFYAPGIAHHPQAGLLADGILIFLIMMCGICLVLFRNVIPALLTLILVYFFEFTYLHDDHHNFWQYAFAIGAIVGQIITLAMYLNHYTQIGRAQNKYHTPGPSTGRYMQ